MMMITVLAQLRPSYPEASLYWRCPDTSSLENAHFNNFLTHITGIDMFTTLLLYLNLGAAPVYESIRGQIVGSFGSLYSSINIFKNCLKCYKNCTEFLLFTKTSWIKDDGKWWKSWDGIKSEEWCLLAPLSGLMMKSWFFLAGCTEGVILSRQMIFKAIYFQQGYFKRSGFCHKIYFYSAVSLGMLPCAALSGQSGG